MKRLLCCVFICIFICGCSSKTNSIKPITKALSFNAEIKYYNESYCCDVDISKNGNTKITFTQPKEINGLIMSYCADKVTAEFEGLEREINSSLPQYSVSDILYKAFSHKYDEVIIANDLYYVENKNLSCKMFIGESGLPNKIEENSSAFKIIIKNATIKSEKEP